MDYPFEQWYHAIQIRQSIREYEKQPVAAGLFDHLAQFANSLNSMMDGVRVVLVKESPEDIFKGAVGAYGKIVGAPSYAVFIGEMNDSSVQEKMGYAGEMFILEATAKGLGTCWIAGFFKADAVKKQVKLNKNEKILSVTPIGYAKNAPKSWDKRLMTFLVKSRKRKGLGELCSGLEQSEWPEWMKCALECARLAPSAINRQPWRFLLEKGSIIVQAGNTHLEGSVSKRLDCGIAMAHIEIGAGMEGVKGTWEFMAPPNVAKFQILN